MAVVITRYVPAGMLRRTYVPRWSEMVTRSGVTIEIRAPITGLWFSLAVIVPRMSEPVCADTALALIASIDKAEKGALNREGSIGIASCGVLEES
jgi:hypothetical protein